MHSFWNEKKFILRLTAHLVKEIISISHFMYREAQKKHLQGFINYFLD